MIKAHNFVIPDKDSVTNNVQPRLRHVMKYRRLPCPLVAESSASLQRLASVDPLKLLDSTEPGPKVTQLKKSAIN